jgi:hypothetical protein
VSLLDLIIGPEPHPELVAVQRPSAADITRAAALLGWLPDADDRFRAVGA